MDVRFETEELDQESLEYLREIHDHEGRGFPGVYLDRSHAKLWAASLPWWALGTGPVVIILTMFMTWGSMRNPTKVALLMTAGFFLGGWMILAWMRCLIARQRSDYVGHFKFIDPLYLWYATGRGVWVTPVAMLVRADVHHQHSGEGNYKSSTVTIHLADGRTEVEINGAGKAEQLETYLNELADVRAPTPAERGYQAIDRARHRDEYDDLERSGKRRVEAIPEPHRVRASLAWLRYLVLLGSIVPLFFVCQAMATFSRDRAIYNAVKDKKHPDIRAYLLDPKNTRYRAELLAKLATVHQNCASKLGQANVPNADVRAGLQSVIVDLKAEARPIVTVRFFSSGTGDAGTGKYIDKDVRSTMDRDMIKVISDRLGKKIEAEDLLDFAEVTDPPAIIEVDAVLTLPAADVPGAGRARIDWTVSFQANPDAGKKVAKLSHEVPAGPDRGATVRQLYKEFANQMLPP